MAALSLTFPSPINMSCQVGDIAYYVSTSSLGGFSVGNESPILIGTVNTITDNGTTVVLVIEIEGDNAESVGTSSFVLFSKNNLVEIGSIKGYFAKTQFRNNSTKPAELHATACEIEDSSE